MPCGRGLGAVPHGEVGQDIANIAKFNLNVVLIPQDVVHLNAGQLLAPGERITAEILEHIRYAKEKGCSMTGPEDPDLERLNVLV